MTNYMDQGLGSQGGQNGQATNFTPQQAPLAPPVPEQPESPQAVQERELYVATQKTNLAEDLDEDRLNAIGKECKEGFDADLNSRTEWLEETKEWMKLARQVREEKTYPWPQASNIKYPLISIAALQFNARAYPTLIPADGKIVKSRVIGADPTGHKRKKGERIATFMSWQFSKDMEHWEEEMDKLLIYLPIVGLSFKESYYNPVKDKIESCLVDAEYFVVDYWTKNLEDAPRYSKICPMTEQDVKSFQLRGYYLDVDLGKPTNNQLVQKPKNEKTNNDFTSEYQIVKQYTWLDLDDDGLREPYIVTFDYSSGRVLSIVARYTEKDVIINSKGAPVGYKADCYFTKFGFIPNPDGSFYDLGFGHLLGPINESVNTIINQLVDAGTLSNLQSGFIGKGLRLRMGDQPLRPGEWKAVNAVGDDIRKQMVPLPTKEPSNVLFQLLGSLITSGKELASVAEIFVGKMPGQNTPATTTMATIEQGMKVFTAIYKRIYRSLDKEFKKVFKLNNYYLDKNTYVAVLDEPVNPKDFDYKDYDICPSADPTATTQTEKLAKAQAVMELMQTGLIDPNKAVMRYLEALEVPNWQELLPGMAETGEPMPPQKEPDPKLMAMQAKAETDQQVAQTKIQAMERQAQIKESSEQAKLAMKAQENAEDRQHKLMMNRLEAQGKAQMNQIFAADAERKAIQGAVEGRQKLVQNDAQFKQKLSQEKSKSSQQKNSKNGKPTR